MAADATLDPADVAALLAVPPEEFVAARTARVKELKAEGRKDEAAVLAKLRKPVRLVWIVGELARRHPAVAATAAEVAEELEDAQAGGSGVRPLLKRFRDVVGQVAELADEIEGTVDRLEVGLALREVLADPAGREAWLEGRLLHLPGDEDDEAPADELAPRRAAKKAAARKKAAKGSEAEADEEAERRAREREAARKAAEEAVAEAGSEVETATSTRDEAADALADLEQQLADLEARVAEARTAVEEADAAVAEAEDRHATAARALADLD
jgi:chromosome segregation ATPase